MLSRPVCDRVLALLAGLGLTLWDPALRQCDPGERPLVLDGLREFREHLGGELTITLLTDIGRGLEVHEMHDGAILRAVERLAHRDLGR
jgi:3-dehydroquinate synthase